MDDKIPLRHLPRPVYPSGISGKQSHSSLSLHKAEVFIQRSSILEMLLLYRRYPRKGNFLRQTQRLQHSLPANDIGHAADVFALNS